jgi:hypothetical protein
MARSLLALAALLAAASAVSAEVYFSETFGESFQYATCALGYAQWGAREASGHERVCWHAIAPNLRFMRPKVFYRHLTSVCTNC